ncbi:alpha/beta fold hydrolase [Nocardia sp. CDC160]|uniref:alpha/beta fold hydrolase n=1 Tax=Nocardia sp. CDC160 TaxID=3112166 RepID=UPI002DBD116E|nr:alpha/beta hydrolase [Nocardia sp. CDC160]MEC3916125.1 alpha/beta hydrolase [Nocardia sp. CDC160]
MFRLVRAAVVTVALVLGSLVAAVPATAAPLPTIVLVHGAFADSSSWDGVVSRLRDDGYHVVTLENPLRGPAYDAAAIQRTIDGIAGPVVLVGHSYGGTVISNVHDAKVESLVYIAAFAPTQGEFALEELNPIQYPGSQLTLALRPKIVDDSHGIAGKNLDAYVDPASFHDVFAQDVDPATAADMAARQHSLALTANLEPSGAPSWSGTPSWYLVSTADRVIPPASQWDMARRMGARISSIDASHAGLVSHPAEVAAVVEAAAGR